MKEISESERVGVLFPIVLGLLGFDLVVWVVVLPLVELYFGVGELTDRQKADLSRKVTDLIVKEAGVPQEFTWVIVHEVPVANWMIDRLTLPELFAKLKAKKK